MTEHCVNNGTSICQTRDATHLIITLEDFCANKTIGFTYSGKRFELEFHLVTDIKAHGYRLSLHVTNNSADTWHILTYKDPLNNNSETTVKELPAKEDTYLYSIREFWFGKSGELIIFFRLDRDDQMLLSEEIDQEQLDGLYRRLESLQQDAQFADMTVNGAPAHRAVLAAAGHSLHQTVAELVSNKQDITEITTDDNTDLTRAKEETFHEPDNIEKLLQAPDAIKCVSQDSGSGLRDVKENINQDMLLLLKKMLGAQVDEQFVETMCHFMNPLVQHMWNTHNSKKTDIEAMERPLPENYTMEIEKLDNKHKESFLRYIYTGDVEISVTPFDLDSLALAENLIAVALHFNVRGLVDAVEASLKNYLHIDASLYLPEIFDLAVSYELNNLLLSTKKVIRSSHMYRNVNMHIPTFLKYILSVESCNNKYQKQCHYTYTVPNISKLNEKFVMSGVFYICGIPLLLTVRKYAEYFEIYLGLKNATKRVKLKYNFTLLSENVPRRETKHNLRVLSKNDNNGWGPAELIAWNELTDPDKGFVENDSVRIRVYVEFVKVIKT